MLLCGADLLATMAQPGVWVDPDVVLKEHGVVCIARDGTEVEALLTTPGTILHDYRDNIIVVREPIPNAVSSTRIRRELEAGRTVKYLLPYLVLDYIHKHHLYTAA